MSGAHVILKQSWARSYKTEKNPANVILAPAVED